MGELIIGFIGILIGSFITGYKDIWLNFKNNKSSSEHLAIELICLFDSFCQNCTDVVSDDGTFHGQPNRDGYCEVQAPLPEFKLPNKNIDWKLLPVQIMYQVLSFPNSIEYANKYIDSAFEHANPPDYYMGFEERQYQYSMLGLEAANISSELRAMCKLPSLEYGNWNPIDSLNRARESIENIRDERDKQNQKRLDEIMSIKQ